MVSKNKNLQIAKYVFSDILTAALSWIIFYSFRKIYIEKTDVLYNDSFWVAVVVIPIYWITLYSLSGYYNEIFRKSWMTVRNFKEKKVQKILGVY